MFSSVDGWGGTRCTLVMKTLQIAYEQSFIQFNSTVIYSKTALSISLYLLVGTMDVADYST